MALFSTHKTASRERRRRRTRAKVAGTSERPRLTVYKSNQYIYTQLIDDETGETLVSASSQGSQASGQEAAKKVAEELVKKASKEGITKAVFDRGGYPYKGNIRVVAETAREGGLDI